MRSSDSRKPNTTCLACGSSYYHCKSCDEYKHLNFWRSNACCTEHFKLYMLAHQYHHNLITADEAVEMLDSIPYQDIINCNTDVAKIIREICKYKNSKVPQKDSEES